jgi:hypothetical protein
VNDYRNTISSSAPGAPSNHTFQFTIREGVPAGGYFVFTPPAGFTTTATSTFSERNVEMYVNGVRRDSGDTIAPGVDEVVITDGSPGSVRYNLNPATGIPAGATIEFRIGNHTTNSMGETEVVLGTSSTTTIPADRSGIVNGTATGTQEFMMEAFGAAEPISAGFLIAIVDQVGVGPLDTTEEIPPFRFGGAPTGTLSGTTFNVEISMQTDEFADCSFSTTPGVDYFSMPVQFNSSGLVVHSAIVSVAPGNTYVYYVRCIDDEGNFNIDDYLIEFAVNDAPTGQPNAEGEVEGDGTGTGNDGTGSGAGGGGSVGGTEGEADTSGQDAGSGGDGGGSGGGGGRREDGSPGGGFENDGPYESGDGRVIISGLAFPGSEVIALVDGQIARRDTAGSDGSYSILIDQIARGVYTFGVYAVDDNDVRSSTFSTSFTVSGARASGLSNINLAPSILVTPDPVDVGAPVTISGFAQPNASVALEVRQAGGSAASLRTVSATAGPNGAWSATLSPGGSTAGTYEVRSRATLTGGANTAWSSWVAYGVGQEAEVRTNADLNRDGRVNLTDFSILLFWWGTPGGNSNPPADINQDGNVSLTDFSILLFNWTG